MAGEGRQKAGGEGGVVKRLVTEWSKGRQHTLSIKADSMNVQLY